MKKLLFLPLLIMVFAFTGCSSDDDDGGPTFDITGTWKLTSRIVDNNVITEGCEFNNVYTFIQAGVYTESQYALNDIGVCVLDQTIGGTWSKSGNSYIITISGGLESVLPLNNNNAIVPTSISDDFNEFRISETTLGTTITLVFTRQ